ncbi:LytR family transcriptional regulator [Occultella glacieicola]|uniref:LytR family transcriptional regulator n=1 Tax=Occultella glacieicola TaxID=2518684 RepID=A0ABY2E814_9MICO|nr:LCP family protein [Occultella glacieicola]TDE96163.1 LytR family transcriptional regulator [Occultella glacieicola]
MNRQPSSPRARHAAPPRSRRSVGVDRGRTPVPAAGSGRAPHGSAGRGLAGLVRHARRRRRPRRHAVPVAGLAVALFAVSGAALAYDDLNRNIGGGDVEPLLGTDRPEPAPPVDGAAGAAVNLLLIGSDDRSGENASIGGGNVESGIRSDTVILAHISADRTRVEMVSIPRDSWVDVPSCELPDGSMTSPLTGKFNNAFQQGGQTGDVTYAAACTIRTVEGLTDVRIDGFVAVDFGGFVDMVDAIGGIPICIPEDIDDDNAHLQLSAGEQVLDGTQALGYARVRKSVGDGSDIGRIGRQQALLAATVRQVLNQNVLTDAPRLYGFLDAATASLSTSSNYASISALSGLAYSLRGLGSEDISFVTVPITDRGDGANVLWTDEADALWEAIAADRPLTVEGTDDGTADASPDPGTDASTDPTEPTGAAASSTATADPGPTLEGTTADDGSAQCG